MKERPQVYVVMSYLDGLVGIFYERQAAEDYITNCVENAFPHVEDGYDRDAYRFDFYIKGPEQVR